MNTTRRHPRTLEQAFGPHTSTRIESNDSTPTHQWVIYGLAVVAVVVIVFIARQS